ncbi:MAG: hypothetical protein E7643_08080 [Ruminococcaceae bacterium]|nr:hypothetical protein [Oscillospiraceae bacterium]
MEHDVIVVKKDGQIWKIIGIVAAALAVCAVAAVVLVKIFGKKKAAEAIEAEEEVPAVEEGAEDEAVEVEVEADEVIENAAEIDAVEEN